MILNFFQFYVNFNPTEPNGFAPPPPLNNGKKAGEGFLYQQIFPIGNTSCAISKQWLLGLDLAVSIVFSSSEFEIHVYRCFPSAISAGSSLLPFQTPGRPLVPEVDIHDTHKQPLSEKNAKIPRKEIKITILQ